MLLFHGVKIMANFTLEQTIMAQRGSRSILMEYITLCLDSTNEVGQWCVRHNYFIVLYHRLHVSTYIQVFFRPFFTGKSIKCYTCWDPIMLTEVTYIKQEFYAGRIR